MLKLLLATGAAHRAVSACEPNSMWVANAMIPAAFEYHRPRSIDGTINLLSKFGDGARVIAGGHSLVPMMKLRMAGVERLIDLQDIAALKGIRVGSDRVIIGAMTTQHELATHTELAEMVPILREAALQIADPQVRYMGTVGGNVANGDPGNDMPAVMQCLNAEYELVGPEGVRSVAARQFYGATFSTACRSDEILTAIRFTVSHGGYAYEKQKRKVGDYATAAIAVHIRKQNNLCVAAEIALTNLSSVPVYAAAAGVALRGTLVDVGAIQASVVAASNEIDPAEDGRGPANFKRHVAGVILTRAITRAWLDA